MAMMIVTGMIMMVMSRMAMVIVTGMIVMLMFGVGMVVITMFMVVMITTGVPVVVMLVAMAAAAASVVAMIMSMVSHLGGRLFRTDAIAEARHRAFDGIKRHVAAVGHHHGTGHHRHGDILDTIEPGDGTFDAGSTGCTIETFDLEAGFLGSSGHHESLKSGHLAFVANRLHPLVTRGAST